MTPGIFAFFRAGSFAVFPEREYDLPPGLAPSAQSDRLGIAEPEGGERAGVDRLDLGRLSCEGGWRRYGPHRIVPPPVFSFLQCGGGKGWQREERRWFYWR